MHARSLPRLLGARASLTRRMAGGAASVARRLPFTAGLLATIVLIAALSGSLTHSLVETRLLERVGYGLPALEEGRLYTLVTSIPFALFPWMLATIAFNILVCVAPYELVAGSRRAAAVFFTAQVGGYALASLLVAWPLDALGLSWGRQLAMALDVGASAGALGCAGALVWHVPQPWRARGVLALCAYLGGFLLLTHRIWDVEHALAGLTGIVAGWAAQEPRVAARMRAVAERLGITARVAIAWLVALAGLMNVVSALDTTPARWEFWADAMPFAVLHGTRTFIAVSGLCLLLLGRGLLSGRRAAWWAAVALLAGSAVSHVAKGLDVEEAAVAAVLFMLLVWRRADFRAAPDAPSLRRSLRLVGSVLAFLPGYVTLGFLLVGDNFDRAVTARMAAREALYRMAFTSAHQLGGATFEAGWFLDSITFVWSAALLVCVVALLRPVLRLTPETPRDRARALELLRAWGDTSTAYMTTWPGNTVLLTAERDAYLAYRLVHGVSLVLGDPIGPRDACRRSIAQFADLARARGWTPCFYGVTARHLDAFAEHGLASMQVGEDSLIDLPTLEFRGRHWQDVRTAVNRAAREGVRFELIDQTCAPEAITRQLRGISDDWVARKGLPEMGFTLGRLSEPPDPEVRTAIAIDAAGIVHGFVTWLPVYRARGWVIDLMRRRDDALPGVMEFLIAESAMQFKAEGARYVGLAAAPLARVPRAERAADARVAERLLHACAGALDPLYGFRSLFEFKRKFLPRWEQLYIVYPGPASLPKIGLALTRAYLPGLGLGDVGALLAGKVVRQPSRGRRKDATT